MRLPWIRTSLFAAAALGLGAMLCSSSAGAAPPTAATVPGVVSRFSVTTYSVDTHSVTLNLACPADGGSPITRLQFLYTDPSGAPVVASRRLNPTLGCGFAVGGLVPGTHYQFSAAVCNRVGCAPMASVGPWTPFGVAKAPILTAKRVGNVVTWSYNLPNNLAGGIDDHWLYTLSGDAVRVQPASPPVGSPFNDEARSWTMPFVPQASATSVTLTVSIVTLALEGGGSGFIFKTSLPASRTVVIPAAQ